MPANTEIRTVGAASALTGVSVRTLHHYDHIGLVVPSVRTAAGYRGYTDADVERLHLVLVYRSVGLSLGEIKTLLDDADVEVPAHLQRQHQLLCEQSEQLQQRIKAVEELMSAHNNGIQLTAEQQVEIFGSAVFEEHAEEAAQRWSDTEEWRQSQVRTAAMTKQDWIEFKAENDALLQALADGLRAGVEPGSAQANALAARHRANISRFYDCSDEMHGCLAQLYVDDERFAAFYDDAEPGLAQFVHDIIVANIDS